MAVGDDSITGTLTYIDAWATPGWDTSLGHHFIAVHAESSTDGATVYAKCVPSQTQQDWTAADSSGDFVFQVTENTEKLCFKASKDGTDTIGEYALSVTLSPEG